MGEVTGKAWIDHSEPRIMAADLEAIEAAIVDALAGGGSGSGVREVSGAVTLDADGPRILEFYTIGEATIGGVEFPEDTAVVFRRTSDGAWTHLTVNWDDGVTTIIPPAPTFTDLPGTVSDRYIIPSQMGVAYRKDGTVIAAGTYTPTEGEAVTITAHATYADETLAGTTTWSHTFSVDTEPPSRADIEQAILADGPVIYLPLQGDLTNRGSITGATLTPVGSPTHSTEMPDGSLGLAFADGDKVHSTGTEFTGTDGFTAEVVAVSSGGNGYMVGSMNWATPHLGTTTVGHRPANTDAYVFENVPTGAVFHLAMTFDGHTLRRYLNGQPAGETEASGAKASWPAILLGDRHTGGRQFVGTMRDVALYPTALPPERILAHAQAHKVTS